jgi:hypothetical protein
LTVWGSVTFVNVQFTIRVICQGLHDGGSVYDEIPAPPHVRIVSAAAYVGNLALRQAVAAHLPYVYTHANVIARQFYQVYVTWHLMRARHGRPYQSPL